MADPAVILTIDTDAQCSRCGRAGTAPNGLCLGCVAKRVTEGTAMGKRPRPKKDATATHAAEQAQPPLIPMSHEEMDKAARELAGKIAELEQMEADHAVRRKEMRDTREALLATIDAIASTIRSQGR